MKKIILMLILTVFVYPNSNYEKRKPNKVKIEKSPYGYEHLKEKKNNTKEKKKENSNLY